MQKYFFDVTDIMRYVETETTISGIQRVSLEVIKRMVAQHGTDRVKISTWDEAAQDYISLEAGFLLDMVEFDAAVLSSVFFGRQIRDIETVPPLLARYRNNRPKYLFHLLRANIEAKRGNDRFFHKRFTTLENWPADKARARAIAKERSTVLRQGQTPRPQRTRVADQIAPGDQIVILGATWGMDAMNAHLKDLKTDKGAVITLLIHDLIPLIKPEHIAADFSLMFYHWLKESAGYCAKYFANSEHTCRDLKTFMDETGTHRPVHVIPLAQALGTAQPAQPAQPTFLDTAEEIAGLNRSILNITKVPYVLVVGTIESRKNLWRLAQAWARLAEDRDITPPKLVLAGKFGWFIEDLRNWLDATGNLNGWIEIAERPTDRELAFLYKRCLFTAKVSLYEGWGLPIGEGLSFGKTAVVADNSSMPEVGGDMVEYCDASSIDSIYQACRKLIADPAHRQTLEAKLASTRLRTWDDVTEDVLAALA